MDEQAKRKLVEEFTRTCSDKGLLIEAGWRSYQVFCVPPDAPRVQVDETRTAFFAGAQHLFASIMGIMESGEEPTEKDMERMGLIQVELEGFAKELQLRVDPSKGRA